MINPIRLSEGIIDTVYLQKALLLSCVSVCSSAVDKSVLWRGGSCADD